jgi:hypothetical protein
MSEEGVIGYHSTSDKEQSTSASQDEGHHSNHVDRIEALHGDFVELDIDRNVASHFRHPPLDYLTRQLRLVPVKSAQSGTGTAPLVCKFIQANIEDPDLRYVALSYT